MAEPTIDREIMDWPKYGDAVRQLAQGIADSGFQPEMILAIARGGLFVAGSLGYALGVKNIYVMNVEYYTGVGEHLDVPVMLPPYVDFVDVKGAKVLIADDVCDTGHTLKVVKDHCVENVGDVRSAVLYEKSHALVKSDYVWTRTDDWINFPWSDQGLVPGAEGFAVLDA